MGLSPKVLLLATAALQAHAGAGTFDSTSLLQVHEGVDGSQRLELRTDVAFERGDRGAARAAPSAQVEPTLPTLPKRRATHKGSVPAQDAADRYKLALQKASEDGACSAILFSGGDFSGTPSFFGEGSYEMAEAQQRGLVGDIVSSFIVLGAEQCTVTFHGGKPAKGWHTSYGPGLYDLNHARRSGFVSTDVSSFRVAQPAVIVHRVRVAQPAVIVHRVDDDVHGASGGVQAAMFKTTETTTSVTSVTVTAPPNQTSTTVPFTDTSTTHTRTITDTSTTHTRTTRTHTSHARAHKALRQGPAYRKKHKVGKLGTITATSTTSSTTTTTTTTTSSTTSASSSTFTWTSTTKTYSTTTYTETTVSETHTTTTRTTSTSTTTLTATTLTSSTTTSSATTVTTATTSSTTSTMTSSTTTTLTTMSTVTASTTTTTSSTTLTKTTFRVNNGDFERGSTAEGFEYTCTVPDWTVTPSNVDNELICPVFVKGGRQRDFEFGGTDAVDGHYFLALRRRGAAVAQTVYRHDMSKMYRLQFYVAKRGLLDEDAHVSVSIDGQVTAVLDATTQDMQYRYVDYWPNGVGVNIELANAGGSKSNYATVYIDSVSSGEKLPDKARCRHLMSDARVWGNSGKGIDLTYYTQGSLKWIGCNGDGCAASTFYCHDQAGLGLEFGTTDERPLRALLGDTFPAISNGCSTTADPTSISNAMDKPRDVQRLCEQLGYASGYLIESVVANTCPEIFWNGTMWTSDFQLSKGYGKKFQCKETATETTTMSNTTSTTSSTLTTATTPTTTTESLTFTITTGTTATTSTETNTGTSTSTSSSTTETTTSSSTGTLTTSTQGTITTGSTTTTYSDTSSTTTQTTTTTTGPATCVALSVSADAWGYTAAGVNVGLYAKGLRWIGCVEDSSTDGCLPDAFFCNDGAGSIEFGASSGLLRAMLGRTYSTSSVGCATESAPADLLNMGGDSVSAGHLCTQLGYSTATVTTVSATTDICGTPRYQRAIGRTEWTSDFALARVPFAQSILCSA